MKIYGSYLTSLTLHFFLHFLLLLAVLYALEKLDLLYHPIDLLVFFGQAIIWTV